MLEMSRRSVSRRYTGSGQSDLTLQTGDNVKMQVHLTSRQMNAQVYENEDKREGKE